MMGWPYLSHDHTQCPAGCKSLARGYFVWTGHNLGSYVFVLWRLKVLQALHLGISAEGICPAGLILIDGRILDVPNHILPLLITMRAYRRLINRITKCCEPEHQANAPITSKEPQT